MASLDELLEWIPGFRGERGKTGEAPFYDAHLSGWVPRRALALSLALHLFAIQMPLPAFRARPAPEPPPRTFRVEYDVKWTHGRRLPLIAPRPRRTRKPKPRQPAPRRKPLTAAAPIRQPQTVVSHPSEPNHPTQTLLTKLDAATAQPSDLRLPNLVIPSAPEVELKPVVRLSPSPAVSPLPRLPSPGEIMMAEMKLENLRPRLAVRPGEPAGVFAPEVGGPQLSRGALGVPGGVVALSATPAAPAPRLEIPEGRLRARFAAGPDPGEGPPGEEEAGAPVEIELSGIAVSGGSGVGVDGPAIAGPPPPAPKLASPAVAQRRSREARIQELLAVAEGGTRNLRVYSTYLYLANLTSQSSSWLLRFSEREPGNSDGGVTAPVVVRKVDPCYPSDAYTERVEGTVLLYGVIGANGAVGDVTVVRATEERLAEKARAAFAQSRFQPARKQGRPVAVDALVEIPFRLALCF